jgi:hypothetical protein
MTVFLAGLQKNAAVQGGFAAKNGESGNDSFEAL